MSQHMAINNAIVILSTVIVRDLFMVLVGFTSSELEIPDLHRCPNLEPLKLRM